MCTVTALRDSDILRLVCNRDERRDRPAAFPPYIVRAGSMLALMPQDPVGRGTWIGANSAGLIFTVLNRSGAVSAARAVRSRGLIIPDLLECSTPDDVATRVHCIAAEDFAPFRLVVADASQVTEFAWSRSGWNETVTRLTHPLIFTSSSLGDAVVERPRRELFEQVVGTACDVRAAQDAFHAHRWRERPAVSVHMSRADACTVSTTVVEVSSRAVRMIYHPVHTDDVGIPAGLSIDRVRVEAAQYSAVA